MLDKNLPPLRAYHPTTFLERGVAVPFTTPMLAGTRARPAEKQGLELVIPNPSGGRGVYIMAWTGISSLCCPTLHDRQLNARVAPLHSVTPSVIRRIGREVAAEGLAGEAATAAAQKSADIDRSDRMVTNYLLLIALVEQLKVPSTTRQPDGARDPAEIQRRAKVAVDAIAPRLGRSPNWIATALESIADTMAVIGIGCDNTTSRVPRLVQQLRHCTADVADWSGGLHAEGRAAYAEMICAVADVTLKLAATTLVRAWGLTSDVVGLLSAWSADPDTIVRTVSRPEWLLDGWEQICLLWDLADDDAARRAALVEMVQLVPVLPREAREWSDLALQADISFRLRRLIPLHEDWRTGATVFDLIARNEHIRARTC